MFYKVGYQTKFYDNNGKTEVIVFSVNEEEKLYTLLQYKDKVWKHFKTLSHMEFEIGMVFSANKSPLPAPPKYLDFLYVHKRTLNSYKRSPFRMQKLLTCYFCEMQFLLNPKKPMPEHPYIDKICSGTGKNSSCGICAKSNCHHEDMNEAQLKKAFWATFESAPLTRTLLRFM